MGVGSNWSCAQVELEPPSVPRARADCEGRLFAAKVAVVRDLAHAILLACQFCDCLRDRINYFICFRGIDFVRPGCRGIFGEEIVNQLDDHGGRGVLGLLAHATLDAFLSAQGLALAQAAVMQLGTRIANADTSRTRMIRE